MANVIFRGPLVSYFGTEKITLSNSYSNIYDLIKDLDKKGIIIDSDGDKIKPGYIILINGKDYRLFSNREIGIADSVEIIPINHGG